MASRREAAGSAEKRKVLQTRFVPAQPTARVEQQIGNSHWTSAGSRSSQPAVAAIRNHRHPMESRALAPSPRQLGAIGRLRPRAQVGVRGVASSASNAAPVPSGRIVRAADRAIDHQSCSTRRQYALATVETERRG